MKYAQLKFGFALLLTLAVIGCKSSTSGPTVESSTTMLWTNQENATFEGVSLDSNTGLPTGPSSASTSIAVTTDTTVYGESNVTAFLNFYANGNSPDTTFYYQDANKNLFVNTSTVFGSSLGGIVGAAANFGFAIPIPSWIEEAEMSQSAGGTWIPYSWEKDSTVTIPSIPIPVPITFVVKDSAVMMADSTFTIEGKQYSTKHARHFVSISLSAALIGKLFGFSENVDAYISGNLGMSVLTIDSPSTLFISSYMAAILPGFASGKGLGYRLQMISHS